MTSRDTYDCIVIGGGPAGMMAAGRAASLGARVVLLEKNKKLGAKLDITGGGRCNITNATFDTRAFLDNFGNSAKFLFSPFSQFSPQDTFTFFEKRGLPLVTEARDRVFPKTQKAHDVTLCMEKYLRTHNVEVRSSVAVKNFLTKNGVISGVSTSSGDIHAHTVVLAAGGVSAPETGSTGDGFRMLSSIGHTVKKPDPNITPLRSPDTWVHELAGVAPSFMTIRFKQSGKTHIKKTGKLLFTHFGVSGPLILNSAHEVKKLLNKGPLVASIDLFPDTNHGDLDRRIWRLFEQHKNKELRNALADMLPKKLAYTIVNLPHLRIGTKKVHSVSKEERATLTHTLKDLVFSIDGLMGFEWAVIADGGVLPEEVDFKTMCSRKYPNLYLIGDTLNINRPSGGYSLQLCWTTGWVAGTHIGSTDEKTPA